MVPLGSFLDVAADVDSRSSWLHATQLGRHRSGFLRRIVTVALDVVAFPFKRITSQYLASLFRSRRARATLPADL